MYGKVAVTTAILYPVLYTLGAGRYSYSYREYPEG